MEKRWNKLKHLQIVSPNNPLVISPSTILVIFFTNRYFRSKINKTLYFSIDKHVKLKGDIVSKGLK